jgi:hypothetical protein
MVSSRSFLLYILLAFSDQRNLLITANVVERRALNRLSNETTNDLRNAAPYYMINRRCGHMKLSAPTGYMVSRICIKNTLRRDGRKV